MPAEAEASCSDALREDVMPHTLRDSLTLVKTLCLYRGVLYDRGCAEAVG